MKIFDSFIELACLLAASSRASYALYANAHCRINSLYHFSLHKNICLSYKTSSLACNHFQIWGGDNSILWLSFAQQKCLQRGAIIS
jgi:hypothetical protein